MLYYLLDWLEGIYNIPGFGVFKFITFRSVMAIIFSLIISVLIGKKIIDILRRRLIGESIRTDGPQSHLAKKGTPTMGGVIIIAAIIIPTLLWADLRNGYVLLAVIATMWMGTIGFIDDYIKVFKKDKKGLRGTFKIIGQVTLGLILGVTMLVHPDFMGSRAHITQLHVISADRAIRHFGFKTGDKLVKINDADFTELPAGETYEDLATYTVERERDGAIEEVIIKIAAANRKDVAKTIFGPADRSFVYRTDFPFLKHYVFDYSNVFFLKDFVNNDWLGYIVYLLVVVFIVTAVSNGVNITDGIDGLAAGTTAIAGATLGALSYVSGNIVFADYLHISYIPLSSELLIYSAALTGGCLGFLWYNSYPAQVFMGDTGSLALGGAIAALALMIKKELLLPILCGIFFVESLSVILQVSYFKYTKRKYGEGRRIFKMAPLHHHYELQGNHESKIVVRFWIVAFFLALLTIATLKLR